jgi:hypothetical protein
VDAKLIMMFQYAKIKTYDARVRLIRRSTVFRGDLLCIIYLCMNRGSGVLVMYEEYPALSAATGRTPPALLPPLLAIKFVLNGCDTECCSMRWPYILIVSYRWARGFRHGIDDVELFDEIVGLRALFWWAK